MCLAYWKYAGAWAKSRSDKSTITDLWTPYQCTIKAASLVEVVKVHQYCNAEMNEKFYTSSIPYAYKHKAHWNFSGFVFFLVDLVPVTHWQSWHPHKVNKMSSHSTMGKCSSVGWPTFCKNWQLFYYLEKPFFSISNSKQFRICEKCNDIHNLINLYINFIFQIGRGHCWLPKFPLCIVGIAGYILLEKTLIKLDWNLFILPGIYLPLIKYFITPSQWKI